MNLFENTPIRSCNDLMSLSKPTYTTIDTIRLPISASLTSTLLHILLTLIHGVLHITAVALSTAHFVDTASAVLQGYQPQHAIYLPLIFLLVVLASIKTIGSFSQLLTTRINMNLKQKLNPLMIQKHAALDYKHIENSDSWEIISRATRNPSDEILNGFNGIMNLTQLVVSISSFFIMIALHIWWAALVIFIFSAPLFWLAIWSGQKTYQARRDVEKFNRRHEYLDTVLTSRENIDERTLFGYSDDLIKNWHQQYETGRLLELAAVFKSDLIVKVSSITLVVIALLIALTLVNPVISGELSVGMFMGVVVAVFNVVQMLGWQLTWALREISQAREYMKDLTAFLSLSESEDALSEPDKEPISFSSLEFRNVRFKYPTGENYILDGMSFEIKKGKNYAFVGKNGVGKTTITKLLTGLYTEYEGEILINGKELRTYAAGTLKAIFSVVFQDFAKYYISLGDNIIVGDLHGCSKTSNLPDTSSRITDVLRHTGLDSVVSELKDGTETPLGRIRDNGQELSGGQWQRIAIARSLISPAPIKILDEPTAALDPISESKIYSEFEKLMQNKTTIFISHRLGSTKLADEILVINNGRVAEKGTHEKLMASDGIYEEMFESQKGWYL